MKLDIPSLSPAMATPAVAPLVLVVDDNDIQLNLLSSSLGRWGYEVITATSGVAA